MFVKPKLIHKAIGFVWTALLTTLAGLTAQAATQGVLDPTSTGDFTITLTIPEQTRLTGLSDVNFGTYSGSGDLDNNQDVCVYSNTPTAGYNIRGNGDGAASAFTITDGGSTIAYRVFWNDATGTAGGTELTKMVWLNAQTGANQTSETCAIGGNSANIRVLIPEANIQGKNNGTYTGTVTFTVEAN